MIFPSGQAWLSENQNPFLHVSASRYLKKALIPFSACFLQSFSYLQILLPFLDLLGRKGLKGPLIFCHLNFRVIFEVPQYSCQVSKLETFGVWKLLTLIVSRSLPIQVTFPISHPSSVRCPDSNTGSRMDERSARLKSGLGWVD